MAIPYDFTQLLAARNTCAFKVWYFLGKSPAPEQTYLVSKTGNDEKNGATVSLCLLLQNI